MSESLISRNIELVQRQLSNERVQERLGGLACKLLSIAESLYIPDVSTEGKIIARDDGIPIVSLKPGDKLHLSGDSLGFSDEQRRSMQSKGVSSRVQNRVENSLADRKFSIPSFAIAAVANRRGTYDTGTGTIEVSGRPIVVLNSSHHSIQSAVNTAVAHELVHVLQEQNIPSRPKLGFPLVKREAEAYSLQGRIEAGLQKGEPEATKANRVMRAYEEFRRNGRTLGEESEQLAFERQLRAEGIGILGKNVRLPGDTHSH